MKTTAFALPAALVALALAFGGCVSGRGGPPVSRGWQASVESQLERDAPVYGISRVSSVDYYGEPSECRLTERAVPGFTRGTVYSCGKSRVGYVDMHGRAVTTDFFYILGNDGRAAVSAEQFFVYGAPHRHPDVGGR